LVAGKLAGQGSAGIVAHQDHRWAAMALRQSLVARGSMARVLTIVDGMNARGCQDMGLVPGLLPGYRPASRVGRGGRAILEAAATGAIRALVLVAPDPGWEQDPVFRQALASVEVLVAFTPFAGAAAELASVLLPGRTIAEKAGTVTNTEGRVQRVRPALQPQFAFPAELRMLGDLAAGMGVQLGVQPLAEPVFELIAAAVPGYRAARGGPRPSWSSPA
jgi:predicted molibdopterin-dependent oxidoreductase YjgC